MRRVVRGTASLPSSALAAVGKRSLRTRCVELKPLPSNARRPLDTASSLPRNFAARAAHTAVSNGGGGVGVGGGGGGDCGSGGVAIDTLRRKLRQNTRYRGTRENIVLLSTFADVSSPLTAICVAAVATQHAL